MPRLVKDDERLFEDVLLDFPKRTIALVMPGTEFESPIASHVDDDELLNPIPVNRPSVRIALALNRALAQTLRQSVDLASVAALIFFWSAALVRMRGSALPVV